MDINNGADIKGFEGGAGETFAKVSHEKKRGRIWEIDFIRGLCVLLMVFDHMQFDFAFLFGGDYGIWTESAAYAGSTLERISLRAAAYWESPLRTTAWPIVIFLFVFLSGISSGFSRSNIKRGARLAVFALLLTLATSILDLIIEGTAIPFGVLHMLSAGMLLYGLVELLLTKIIIDKNSEGSKEIYKFLSVMILTGLGLLLALIGSRFENKPLVTDSIFLQILVKTKERFYSADSFTVLPWVGYMFLGAAFGKIFYSSRKSLLPEKLNDSFNKYTVPVTFTGRNAVWFYLLHQPIVFGLLYLTGLLAGMGGV